MLHIYRYMLHIIYDMSHMLTYRCHIYITYICAIYMLHIYDMYNTYYIYYIYVCMCNKSQDESRLQYLITIFIRGFLGFGCFML